MHIGNEQQPVIVVDGFHPDPDDLRAAAAATAFGPAINHYPGIRAGLPADYFAKVQTTLVRVIREIFGYESRIELIDASFSIVTYSPDKLSAMQRVPHFDALEPGRIALVHYLSPSGSNGTAFFRHRETGFELLDQRRAPGYFDHLNAAMPAEGLPPMYINDSTPMFQRIAAVDGVYNRAVIYRSALLHSGAIAPDATLNSDPATGRLTVTGFLRAR